MRVFISYAHDDEAHEDRVREFWLFLRAYGLDAQLDLPAAEQRQDWAQWMTKQVLMLTGCWWWPLRSTSVGRKGTPLPEEGRGVQWEARLIREVFYADQRTGAGARAARGAAWLFGFRHPAVAGPSSATHYVVSEYTVRGAETLLRVLTGQPWEIESPLGGTPILSPRSARQLGTGDGPAGGRVSRAVWVSATPGMSPSCKVARCRVWLRGRHICSR